MTGIHLFCSEVQPFRRPPAVKVPCDCCRLMPRGGRCGPCAGTGQREVPKTKPEVSRG